MLNVKKYREALGITQREAARQLGITPQRYNNYEVGIRECNDYELLLRMGELFGVSVEQLLRAESDTVNERRAAVAEKLEKLSDEQLDRLLAALESILNE